MNSTFLLLVLFASLSCSIGISEKSSLLVASVKGRRLRTLPVWSTLAGFNEMFDSISGNSGLEYLAYLRALTAIETTWVTFDDARSDFGYYTYELVNSKQLLKQKAKLFKIARDKLLETANIARKIFGQASRIIVWGKAEWMENYLVQWCVFVSLVTNLRIEDAAVCGKLGQGMKTFMNAQREVQENIRPVMTLAFNSLVKADVDTSSSLKSTYLRADIRLLELLAGICAGAKIEHRALVVQLAILDSLESAIPLSEPGIDIELFMQRKTDFKGVKDLWSAIGELKEKPEIIDFKCLLIFQIRSAIASIKCFR